MSEGASNQRDLVLAPNEFIHVIDETKGSVITYVGPTQTSLGGNDKPVLFDHGSKRFKRVKDMTEAIQQFVIAPEGWYATLKNPAPNNRWAEGGKNAAAPDLMVGRKINIPGPTSFPLWPGMMADILKGHHLRHNQYSLVRVYDDAAAKENWGMAIVKSQVETPTETGKPGEDGKSEGENASAASVPTFEPAKKEQNAFGINADDLTMGQLFIVKGTDVAFFVPPTGIEVVPDGEGKLIRRAVTLERLEYCILLDEDGNKRFVKGPDVVFPAPTESFLRRKNEDGKVTRKFRAIELNEQMGLYIKVIADYEEDGTKYKAGDELFLTGKEVRIYYPQEEHAIMRYGAGHEIHYAVAIPLGEGRYLLDKPTGVIDTIEGPDMLLADPKTKVIVNRLISKKMCELMYPGNQQALDHNMRLAQLAGMGDGMEQELKDSQYSSRLYQATNAPRPEAMAMMNFASAGGYTAEDQAPGMEYPEGALETPTRGGPVTPRRSRKGKGLVADDFTRKTKFTPPRSITLDTKFQGAVMVNVWTGYAVQISSKSGERRVEVGPQTILLDYDENLEVFKLSKGRPKGSTGFKEDVYLRVLNNKVNDLVQVETKDFVDINVDVSYRVNFEGEDKSKWFAVEDYVKFLCDHLRSILKNVVKKTGVEEFSAAPIDIIRDAILGVPSGDDDKPSGRPGRTFKENNMKVYDVEVLNVTIGDAKISQMLKAAQHDTVRKTLDLQQKERDLDMVKRKEAIDREIHVEVTQTTKNELQMELERLTKDAEVELTKIEKMVERNQAEMQADVDKQESIDEISTSERARRKADSEQKLAIMKIETDQVIEQIKAEAEAWVSKAKAIEPDLIAAMQAQADAQLLSTGMERMSPLAILGGKSVKEVVNGLLKGTRLDNLLADKEGLEAAKRIGAGKS